MYNIDNVRYVKMGLLIGLHKPDLGAKLMKVETLEEIGKLLNEELGTDIQRGDTLQSVVSAIEYRIRLDETDDDS